MAKFFFIVGLVCSGVATLMYLQGSVEWVAFPMTGAVMAFFTAYVIRR